MVEMVNAIFSGDISKALKIHMELIPLFKALFIETNPLPVKAAMHLMRLLNNEFRLPLVPPKESTVEN